MITLVVAQPLISILPPIIIIKTSITAIKIIIVPPPPLRTLKIIFSSYLQIH